MINLRNSLCNPLILFQKKSCLWQPRFVVLEMRMRPGGVNDKVLIKKYAEVFSLGHPRKYIHVSLRF